MSYNILNLTKIEPFLNTGLLTSASTNMYSTSSANGIVRVTDLEFFNTSSTVAVDISVRLYTNTTSTISEVLLQNFRLEGGATVMVASASVPIWLGPHDVNPRTNAHGIYVTVTFSNQIRYLLSGENFG